jgi:hypothetical protein
MRILQSFGSTTQKLHCMSVGGITREVQMCALKKSRRQSHGYRAWSKRVRYRSEYSFCVDRCALCQLSHALFVWVIGGKFVSVIGGNEVERIDDDM